MTSSRIFIFASFAIFSIELEDSNVQLYLVSGSNLINALNFFEAFLKLVGSHGEDCVIANFALQQYFL